MDRPVPDWILDALRYVNLVEVGGGTLTDAQVDAFASAPLPSRPPSARPAPGTNGLPPAGTELFGHAGPAQEPRVGAYLRRVGWMTSSPEGTRVTALGRAVLRGSERLAGEVEDDLPADDTSGTGRRFQG